VLGALALARPEREGERRRGRAQPIAHLMKGAIRRNQTQSDAIRRSRLPTSRSLAYA
jgi:hypothetical protein